jgi:hypothetical protein
MREIFFDLWRFRDVINFIAWADLTSMTPREGFWSQCGDSSSFRVLQLVGREQSAVRNARAAVFGMDDAADFGFERMTDGIEEIGERR